MATVTDIPLLDLQSRATLHERAVRARAMLKSCGWCELRCGADRAQNAPCPCRLGTDTYEYKRYVSLNEEPEFVPSLRVFLSGCDFRCRYCDEAPGCFEPLRGRRIEPEQWAARLIDEVSYTGKCVSFLGGEPTLHTHTILAIAAALDGRVPLALNTNMYMTPEVLDLLDGAVACYLADFKFGNDACARQLAGIPLYLEVVQRNLLRAARSTAMIVRHLLLPEHFECCFRPVVDWVSTHLPDSRFQLYTGYVPCRRASGDPLIGRLNTPDEARRAVEYLGGANLRHKCELRVDGGSMMPLTPSSAELSLTVGTDGAIYCHDLTPELVSVLRGWCKDTPELAIRLAAIAAQPEDEP
jgi:putative pyruvate formate lyase activating enzyme